MLDLPDLEEAPQPMEPGLRLHDVYYLNQEEDLEPPYVWEGVLPASATSLLAAKPKAGKSTLARNLMAAVTQGQPFLGRATTQGPVVYLCLEERRREVLLHLKQLGAAGLPGRIFLGTRLEHRPDLTVFNILEDAINRVRAVLAVVDPLARFTSFKDGNDYADVTRVMTPLTEVARITTCHVMLVHHMTKRGNGGDAILGSTALFGSVDTALLLDKRGQTRYLESIQRYGEDLPRSALTYNRHTGVVGLGRKTPKDGGVSLENLLECLGQEALTADQLRQKLAAKRDSVYAAITLALGEGEVERLGSGRSGDPYQYRAAPGQE